jgi:hypothetical protein
MGIKPEMFTISRDKTGNHINNKPCTYSFISDAGHSVEDKN